MNEYTPQQYQHYYYLGSHSFRDLPPCTITVVLFFGSIIFTSVSMAVKSLLVGDISGKKGKDFCFLL